MKIFDSLGKYNFVDEKNVFVGFDSSPSCCESYGYFLSSEQPKHGDDRSHEVPEENLHNFNFVTDYFKEIPEGEYVDAGGAATFKLNDGGRDLFLTIFNSHNGYYSHGFEMIVDQEIFRSGSL